MGTGRFSLFLLAWAVLCFSLPGAAQAGWWFNDTSPWEKSGLDLQQGYDQNTVITIAGTITELDLEGAKGPAQAKIQTETETLNLVLGPKDYWQENGMPLALGDVVLVRGSKAQGQDGQIYLMVQNIQNGNAPLGSEATVLRSDNGRPHWSGTNRALHQRQMQQAPMRHLRNGGGRP